MPQVRHVEAVIVPIGDAGSTCLADLDIDGNVGILDLLTLLAAWCSVAGGNPCGTCGP